MAKAFNPDTLWQPFGAFSQMVIGGSGKTLYLKGQVSLNREGEVVGAHDMSRQVEQVLCNLRDLLASVNGRMSDIVSLNHFTTDIAAFMACGSIRQKYFIEPYPVTTTVEVSSLYDPRLVIEISGVAEVPLERFEAPPGAPRFGN
ncbi:MAG: RidA family protein [Burkholderiaceae bacterium]